jgi:AAA domain
MSSKLFTPLPMNRLDLADASPALSWLWLGFLARGNITLLTSQWKTGKTTLVTGLLQHLSLGGDFLGCSCEAARAVVLSEEPRELWASRQRITPLGPHAQLLARPFPTRPTPVQWNALVEEAVGWHADGTLDLLVVDTLAAFLPGRTDSDPNTLLEMLRPLQRLAETGVAVLLLHHPRKKPSEEGSAARGSGALLGFVDIILELHGCGRLRSEERRRRIVGLSRHRETPRSLAYQWDPDTGRFAVVPDPATQRYRDNWQTVLAILATRTVAATHAELLADWPADAPRPGETVLYEWLNRAVAEKLVRRQGAGRRADPYRYRLPTPDDDYRDRGELPPFAPLT